MSVGPYIVTCYDIEPAMTGSFSITKSNNVLTFSTNTLDNQYCLVLFKVVDSNGNVLTENTDYTKDVTSPTFPIITMLITGTFYI